MIRDFEELADHLCNICNGDTDDQHIDLFEYFGDTNIGMLGLPQKMLSKTP